MEFLSRSGAGDGPLVAFGGSDGVIRVLSMITWKVHESSCGNLNCYSTIAVLVKALHDKICFVTASPKVHWWS